ncbi:hypothetical protein HD554DRAFT_2057048 [Boletus coccyginus]|nr:hypothetical protein HD554DRAFT_2057048 [Boletus coccyginus]
MKALAAGKHVLVEKPSANTAEETRHMFEFANQKGLVLLETFHYRFHPAIQRVKEIVDNGKPMPLCFPKGLVTDDNIRMNYDIGGGALMELSNRLPAQLRSLFGEEQPNRYCLCICRQISQRYARIDTATSTALLFPLPSFGFILRWSDVSVRVICEQGSVEIFDFPQPVIFHTIKVSPARRKVQHANSPSSGLKEEE